MQSCKICSATFKEGKKFSSHVKSKHNLLLIEYYTEYENFIKPTCIICGNVAKLKSGLHYRKTCASNECFAKACSLNKHSEETKQILRDKRLKFMKENPEQTAWRTSQISIPEKMFLDKIIEINLDKSHLIVREYPVHPYYIDFAFINEKVAIEIDGSQHLQEDRRLKDLQKDKLLSSLGWRVYRVQAALLYTKMDDVINEIKTFLLNDELFLNSGLLTNKQYKNKLKEEKKLLKLLNV